MVGQKTSSSHFCKYYLKTFLWLVIGATLAAGGVSVILIPNNLVDGGIVGIAMVIAHLFGSSWLPYFVILLNLPFVILAYRRIGRNFVIQMMTAVSLLFLALLLFEKLPKWLCVQSIEFHGDPLEVVVLGGLVIGSGIGLIIRHGGSTDGTEILGIIMNQKLGFTVGQVILFANIFVFAFGLIVFRDLHAIFLSLMTYIVATKIMDLVIAGFEDMKSVIIVSKKTRQVASLLTKNLGIGLTVIYGRGGFSGEEQEILFSVVERLQLAELKEILHQEDPEAFIAIENLHEVINGKNNILLKRKMPASLEYAKTNTKTVD